MKKSITFLTLATISIASVAVANPAFKVIVNPHGGKILPTALAFSGSCKQSGLVIPLDGKWKTVDSLPPTQTISTTHTATELAGCTLGMFFDNSQAVATSCNYVYKTNSPNVLSIYATYAYKPANCSVAK